jgi:2-polyprenyl-6-methoxyphenol hydroxylase-like FAD-dependent oxidoreductase
MALPVGAALGREALDTALVQAAIDAGAAFLPQTRAALANIEPDSRTVALHQAGQQRMAAARLVLAADGLGGRLLAGESNGAAPMEQGSRIGAGVIAPTAPAFYQPGTIFMVCGAGGYLGLVRLEDGRLDVAAAFDPVLLRRAGGPGKAARPSSWWPASAGRRCRTWRTCPGVAHRG